MFWPFMSKLQPPVQVLVSLAILKTWLSGFNESGLNILSTAARFSSAVSTGEINKVLGSFVLVLFATALQLLWR